MTTPKIKQFPRSKVVRPRTHLANHEMIINMRHSRIGLQRLCRINKTPSLERVISATRLGEDMYRNNEIINRKSDKQDAKPVELLLMAK